uniref:NB-ARC domain-containing protein n=1 Tax=Oryza meridionalis TaxID=40149 RepID=A0A0E0EQN5_9ORYZ
MASSLFFYIFGMKPRILSHALPQQSYLSSAESPSLADHVNEEVAKLDRTVQRITAVLVDADEREIADETMKLWISELKQVTWEAEGILEDYSYELLRSTTVQEEKNILDRISKVRKFLDEISRDRVDLGLIDQEGLCRKESRISRCTSSLLDPLEVYGREDEKKLIISSLLDGCLTFKKRRLKEHEYETCKAGAVRLISIVAMGGMGKTTLARLVYNDARVQNHFDIQAWVWVSEVFDEVRLTKAAIESVTAKPCDLTELEPLQRQLHKEVKGKKILLVFDDVWNEDTVKWETMKRPFSAVATGSHMIITTRNENVSTIVQAKKVIHLGGLQKDDSWALFCKLSFPDNACRETELGPIGRKIVEKSDGVPLVLKTLGAMLSLDTSLEFWNYVLTSDLWELGPGWDHILPILKLSYYSLPAILKRCFTFLAAFPRGHKFDLEELVHMWCALGFIQEDSAKRMEEIGHLYVNELVRRSFLQNLQLAGSREKFVIVHDLIHDLAKSIGGKEILVKKCCGSSVGGCNTSANNHLRYLAVLAGTTPFYSDNKLVPFTLPVAGHFPLRSLSFQSKWRTYLRSCVCVQSQWWYNLEGCLLHSPHLKYLRILDVSSSDQIKLDKSVGVLHHLRYLGMCQREIPEAISKMYKLQTLRNTYPFDMIFLPRNVTALSNLRHLVLPRGFPVTIPSGIHRLTKLQSLSTFAVADVGSGAAMLDEIKDINTLQGELCIMDLQNITHDRIWEPRSANLSKKKLTRLELVWNPLPSYKSVPHDEVVLESLQPHNCIRQLVISGFRGLNFSSWLGDRSLFSLQELELCKCYYTDHLPPLGQLPNLKQLKLTSLWKLRSIGPEFYGDCEAPFQCLETMVVQNLVAWEEWWLPENHPHCVFPLLHTIDIRGSHKLVRLPLSNLHALAAITVLSCSKLETIVGLKERCEVTAGNSGLKAGQTNVLPSLRRVKVTACPSLEEPLISMLRRQTEIGFSYWEQSPSTSPTDIADFGKTTWKDCGKTHFENVQKISDTTTLPFAMHYLRSRIMEELDISHLTEKLMHGKGESSAPALTPKEKTVSSIWAMTLLSLYVRVQVTILGRHLYLDFARVTDGAQLQEGSDTFSKSGHKDFLATADYLATYGINALITKTQHAATEILKEKQLKDPMGIDEVLETILQILKQFMGLCEDNSWINYLVPENANVYAQLMAVSSSGFDDSSLLKDVRKLDQLMSETRIVLSRNIMDRSLKKIASVVVEDLAVQIGAPIPPPGLPLAKLLAKVAQLSLPLLEEPDKNKHIQIIRRIHATQKPISRLKDESLNVNLSM